MADPFGIIGVIGVASQIIQMGIQFGLDWKDAPADVKSFTAELQVLKTIISETNTNIALNQDFINAFPGRHSTVLSQFTDATPATDTSVMFLNGLVAIDSAALQATILKEVREGRMKQQARDAAVEQDAILHWLTPVDYAPQQSDFINRRQVGTGQWLLDSPEFQVWVQTEKRTLFCHGIPGAGKTILTSIVVDELMARFGNDKGTGMACIYCNFRRQDEQKAEDLFASLLKQLAQGRSFLPDSVKCLHNKFLLAQLHFDSLKGKRSPKAIRAAVKNLATGSDAYDSAYDDAMERMEGQLKDEKELAKQALYWITCAKRPLIIIELQHALAVEIGEPELDQENITDIQDIISEYFHRTRGKWFPNATTEIAIVCATYLSFSAFESGFTLTGEEFKERLQSNPFYDYAATNWGHHAREASTSIQEVINFLECDAKVEASSQRLMFKDYGFQTVPSYVTGLHLAAYFGVYEAAKVLPRGDNVDLKDSGLRTPLSLAAECGHDAVVKVLLEKGADIESKCNFGWMLFLSAVKKRYEAFFSPTFEKGTHSKFSNMFGESPLSLAAQYGHEAVAKILLEKGADIKFKSMFGRIPLSLAAMNGHEVVVKVILEKGADIEWKDNDGGTPLSLAAEYGRKTVVKLLLEKGADIESKDDEHRTPLSWAAISGHEAVVRMLLGKGVDVESKDNEGRTPLSLAAEYGREAVVKLLLEQGADIKSKDNEDRTPLSWTVISGYETVSEVLRADISLEYNRSLMLRPLAAAKSQAAVIQLLLDRGADVNSKDKDGQTPLSWALQSGRNAISKQLQTCQVQWL
ncbi:hypothetical protein DL764_004189 [Monosporascus ibericus]|uniref:Uncharacterized protein n=1 Tax=Monosporascus ibericus TaxID=155417 RepID=A0A4Q4TDM5_9PEZI|nr:hypothetical protein DL764_004189 [Monosporascus ibericus]